MNGGVKSKEKKEREREREAIERVVCIERDVCWMEEEGFEKVA